jgi:hypothetical protein
MSKRRFIIMAAVLLSLTLTAAMTASLGLLPGTTRRAANPQQGGNFNASNPTKEYIYAGGKLVATQEPEYEWVNVQPPTSLVASAASTTQINLSWNAPSGGANYSYQIERSTNYGTTTPEHGFTILTTIGGTSFTDNVPATSPATTYIYRVRSINGQQTSSPSAISFATTKSFAEQISNQDPGRTTIKATHFLELQEAVNAVRAAAGLAPFTWTDPQAPAPGVPIRKTHMTDLRTALNQALTALGLTPQPYTDDPPTIGVTTVQKIHIDELRQRTRSVGQ